MSTSGGGWQPDPTGRHQYRWWDGVAWSDVVADQGVEYHDPIGVAQPSAAPGAGYGQAAQQPSGGYGAPDPGQYPSGGHMGQQLGSGQYPPGVGPGVGPAGGGHGGHGGRSGGRSGAANAALAGLGVLIVALLVVLGVVVANRGDDGGGGAAGPDEPAANVDPRTALVTLADLPAGWTEAEVTYPPGENQVCEPRLEPPTPPRASERSFDRLAPSGAITHRVVEYTPEFAADYVAEARRQAGECGTFETETGTGGETQRFTGTSELLTGPSFGDETVWYRIQVDYELPAPSSHAVLVVLDRHDGVLSGFTLSTTSETTSDADRTMVEDLARLAAERLAGEGGA